MNMIALHRLKVQYKVACLLSYTHHADEFTCPYATIAHAHLNAKILYMGRVCCARVRSYTLVALDLLIH